MILYLLLIPSILNLTVNSPLSLKNQFKLGVIQDNILNLGEVPYGKSIKGEIIIANPINECAPFAMDLTGKTRFIVLVKRHECPFVAWSIFAQQIGASALIIVNNNDDDIKEFNM